MYDYKNSMDIMSEFEDFEKYGGESDKKKNKQPPKATKTPHTKPPAPPPRPTAPAPPVSKSMSIEEKTHLLDLITAYRERFSFLKKRNSVSVKSTDDELRDELAYTEMQLGSRKESGAAGTVLCTALTSLEVVTRDHYNPLGLDLSGLGQIARENMTDIQPLLDELTIKYSTGMSMCVEVRLAMSLGVLVYTVHSANIGNEKVAEVLSKVSKPIKVPKGVDDL
jgi:hypothetical protein